MNSTAEQKILEQNLSAQNAIKKVSFFSTKKNVGISLEWDQAKISKQQIMDIINLSGDFNIEETLGRDEAKNGEENPVIEPAMASSNLMYLGLACGLFLMSMVFNIILLYIIIK
ncbi:TPA: hypothetical protein DF272_01815 [Candidatus Falkowbacteria bacterium]|nr:hypothetical protein [Candidatus Falkowbacteria bacterium]